MKYFGNIWVDWMIFVLNVLIDILRNGKFTKWFLRVIMMNIKVMLRLCTPGVWDVCSLGHWMKFENSLNIRLMRLGSMKILERPLITHSRPLCGACYTFRWESIGAYIFWAPSYAMCFYFIWLMCSFDHEVDTCPLLARPHWLKALVALNRELYFRSLLKTDLCLRSSSPKARSCDDSNIRREAPIPLRYGFHDDTHSHDLEEVSDPSSPLAVAPSLEFSTISDHPKGSLTIHDSSLHFSLRRAWRGRWKWD